ncbi:MAG: hypothetical protein RL514_3087 [Verrucomicrobiota bacterium]|jgi:curved DNA-binding protein
MPVEFKDYYVTLGVARDASGDDIKKAFRKLARQHHPDVAADKKGGEEKFKAINEAYEVLSDPEKRKKYDQLAVSPGTDGGEFNPRADRQHGGDEPGVHFGGTGFSDFFERFFGGANHSGVPGNGRSVPHEQAAAGAHARHHGSDIEGDLLVTLEEAMRGAVRPISMQTINHQTSQVETHSFQVRIPPGTADGRLIRVPGKGEPGTGGAPAGDLFLRVRHAAHPDFTTRDADVFYELAIAPWEAVLGAEVTVPTLDGSIKLRVPAGAVIGQKLRVRGRGLPQGKTGERGDYFVVLEVQLPTSVSAEERLLWEKLRDASTLQPRQPPSA